MAGPAWMEQALCAQVDTNVFFPKKGGTTAPALDICRRCPVAAECLDYALERREQFGIWGGMAEQPRRRLLADDTDEAEDTDDLCGTYPKGYERHRRKRAEEPCLDCRLAYNAYQRARAAARAATAQTERPAS